MLARPSATGDPRTPESSVYRAAHPPDVGVVMRHPTACAIHDAGCFFSCLRQFTNHLKERLMQLCEIRLLCRPVVHLGVNVNRVLTVPRRVHLIVPYTL